MESQFYILALRSSTCFEQEFGRRRTDSARALRADVEVLLRELDGERAAASAASAAAAESAAEADALAGRLAAARTRVRLLERKAAR
jgi:hypothetical protein